MEFFPLILITTLALIERVVYVRYLQARLNITFLDAPVRSLVYFSLWSFLFYYLFPDEVALLFTDVTFLGVVSALGVLFVFFPYVFRRLRADLGAPHWLTKAFPTQGLLTLEEQYIVAKVGDVVSQQLVAGIIIVQLLQMQVPYPGVVLAFVAIFGLSHLYLFTTSGFIWGLYYTALAVAGAFAIPFFIVFVPGGIVWAILFHMLFYILAGIFFAKLPRPSVAVYRDVVGTDPQ